MKKIPTSAGEDCILALKTLLLRWRGLYPHPQDASPSLARIVSSPSHWCMGNYGFYYNSYLLDVACTSLLREMEHQIHRFMHKEQT